MRVRYSMFMVCVLLVLASACSGDPQVGDGARGTEQVGSSTALASDQASIATTRTRFDDPDEPTPVGSSNESDQVVFLSPIDQAVGYIADPDRLSAIYHAAYQNHAESIDACLAEEGYADYVAIPWDSPEPEEFLLVDGADSDLARFGYGIAGGLRAQHRTITNNRTGQTEGVGPNHAFLARISDEERTAFNWVIGECRRAAWEAYPLPDSYPADLADEIFSVRDAAYNSIGVQQVWLDWSRCMAAAGFRFPDRDSAAEDLYQEAVELEFMLEELALRPSASDDAVSDEFLKGVDQIEAVELKIVEADLRCAAEIDLDSRIDTVMIAAEGEWLEDNLDRVALAAAEAENQWYADIGIDSDP